MKVVLDTNVLLAAFGSRGLCESVFEACLAFHDIHLSEYIFSELARQLPQKLKMPVSRAEQILSFLRSEATIVTPTEIPAGACRDPKDAAILGTAIAAGAACLVTGDKDLLCLEEFRGIPILSPRDFYDKMK